MTPDEIRERAENDIPPRVWRDYKGNRQVLKIVPVQLIPTNREFRNADAAATPDELKALTLTVLLG